MRTFAKTALLSLIFYRIGSESDAMSILSWSKKKKPEAIPRMMHCAFPSSSKS